MRQIKYIFINDSMPTAPRGKSSNICVNNLGHHYVANSEGEVLKLIDVCRPGSFLEREARNLEPRERERLSQCSIGIKYNGSLKHETCNLKQRAALIRLLVELRSHFPDAKILGLTELAPATRNLNHRSTAAGKVKPGTRGSINVRDDMNALRRELSNYP